MSSKILNINILKHTKRTQVIAALAEGVSIMPYEKDMRFKVTILRLLEQQLGCACAEYHSAIRNLKARRVQCDEIWSFVYAKAKGAHFLVDIKANKW
jgi:hypothetical protein